MRAIILLFLAAALCRHSYGADSDNKVKKASDLDVGVQITRLTPLRPIIVSVEHHKYPSDPWFSDNDIKIPKYLARRWQTKYAELSKSLVSAAEKEHLDFKSLAKTLELVRGAKENKGVAVLPVAAHATKVNGELVWVVSLRWEGDGAVKEFGDMGHIRSFTFTQKTLKQIAFNTCD